MIINTVLIKKNNELPLIRKNKYNQTILKPILSKNQRNLKTSTVYKGTFHPNKNSILPRLINKPSTDKPIIHRTIIGSNVPIDASINEN